MPQPLIDQPLVRAMAGAAGAAGALSALVWAVAIGLAIGQPTFPELLADAVIRVTPLVITVHLVDALGANAKHLLFTIVLVGHVCVAAAVCVATAHQPHALRSASLVSSSLH